ncbi:MULTISPECIES: hypothetical protein [unclassified Pseudactinotalea]|uniref:hypothetical protein n=1 Tax=Micrococcales TaxID=85006 RepID=UPI003C7E4BEF
MAPKTAVRVMTVEEAKELRADLVRRLPFSEEELRHRAQRFDLDPRQLAAYDEIEDLDYLLKHAG